LSGFKKDISSLGVALGHVREWDVFIAQTVEPMCQRMAGHPGLKDLCAACVRQRATCYAALRGPVQAHELQRLLLRFAIWMNGAYWQQTGWRKAIWQQQAENVQTAHDFATRRLDKLAKRFALSGQQLSTADAARLHALRIVAKKLRYSAEFFAALYSGQKSRPYVAALSEVQDVLGQINDIAVAHRLLDGLAADAALAEHQEAVVLARGWIAHDLSGLLTDLLKSMRNFNKQPVFWKK
jgi:CHAD domain-containing protein